MAAFTRTERRMVCQGVQLTRTKEGVDPGKWPVLENVRSNVPGTIHGRAGMIAVPDASFSDPIHTIARYDDYSIAATAGNNFYFIGAGDTVYFGSVAGPFPSLDNGWASVPISWSVQTPPQTPQPWMYMANVNRMRKFNSLGNDYRIGIQAPNAEPATELQQLGTNIIEQFQGLFVGWVQVGSATVTGAVNRVNTTVASVLYDLNAAPGYASVIPASMTGITDGMLLTINGVTAAVTQVTIPVAATTVAAIQFDSGSTGMCTIQPAASLGTGQLDGPSVRDYQTRLNVPYAVPRGTAPGGTGTGLPPVQDPTAATARIRILDFPVNCVINLGGELVRIHAIAVGPDGVQSFRCFTTLGHAAGEAITGVAAFRVWTNATINISDTITDGALTITMSVAAPVSPATSVQATGGMRNGAGWATRNLALINGRSTLPDDDVYLAIRADNFTLVQTVRVYFALEPTAGSAPNNATDFTQNYFFHEWRQSDLTAAIQAVNADNVSSLQVAREVAQANAITNQPTTVTASTSPSARGGVFSTRGAATPNTEVGVNNATGQTAYVRQNPAAATTNDALSQQLALGNNQWITLKCKVKDLVHIGTDPTKTLANVTGAEVLISMSSAVAATVHVDIDGLWIAGGYGLDVGPVGNPYVWCFRYRSSLTGARSNPSPPTRGGVIPKRQWVQVTPAASSDPQVDLIDLFRMGGNLTSWTYVGTTQNSSPVFNDVYEDRSVDGGEGLDVNLFPPFPVQDLRRTGSCNVAGSSITWVSGDTFDPNWAPGSLITINNQTYTLYGSPTSTTRLFIYENAGALSGVPFVLPGPTIINKNWSSVWGGPVAGATFLFGCGNTTDGSVVAWSNGNDVETASDKNLIPVTTDSEPLQAGFMWDGFPYVASTDNIYRLEPTFGGVSAFTAVLTPAGRGFWSPWAWCLAPEGVYFVAKDGIFLSSGGSPAVSITDADLYPLFPHEGVDGQAVNGYQPIAMTPIGNAQAADCGTAAVFECAVTQNPHLRLMYDDGWVKFDYMDITGANRSLCYHVASKAWFPDTTTPGIAMRWAGTGRQVHQELIGGVDGQMYLEGGNDDNCVPIACHAQFVDNQQDVRRMKIYRDLFLKGDLSGAAPVVTVGFTDNSTVLTPTTLTGLLGLRDYLVDTVPQTGIFGTNITVDLVWQPSGNRTPEFQVADIAYQLAPELASSWLSGPTTLGGSGYKQIQRALICYLSTGAVTLSVIIDGVLYTYTLPTTGGQYAKNELPLQSVKGKTFQFGMQGGPFLLFDRDCEMWTQQWGAAGGYQIERPF